MSITAAKIIKFLASLFEFLIGKGFAEEFDGFLVIFESKIAISNIEANIMILFDGGDSFLQTISKLHLFYSEYLECILILPISIEFNPNLIIIFRFFLFFYSLSIGPIQFKTT